MSKPEAEAKKPAKQSKGEKRAEEAAKQKAAAQQKRMLAALLMALSLNGLLAWYLYDSMVLDAHRQRLQEASTQQANARVNAVEQYVRELNQQLLQTAQRQDLAEALASGDPEELDRLAGATARRFPGGMGARLVPAGRAELDREGVLPVRYAELDLLRRAQRREATPPEVVRLGDDQLLHIATAVPPESEETALGVLMVTLTIDHLISTLDTHEQQLGRTELLQQFPGAGVQTLHQSGTGAAGPAQERPVSGSYWRVRFTPSETLQHQTRVFPQQWLFVIAGTTIFSLVLAWLLGRFTTMPLTRKKVALAPMLPAEKLKKATSDEGEQMPSTLYQNRDVLDITVIDEDEDILGVQQSTGKQAAASPADNREPNRRGGFAAPEEIFRAYDIRGLADSQLTPELAFHVGRALGSEARDQGENCIVVARDGRTHSQALCEKLIDGLLASGCQVIDIGVVPTPLLYFATHHLDDTSSGVMVTASHNPAQYNGFKVVIDGVTLADEAIDNIRQRMANGEYHTGEARRESRDIVATYIDRILSDVALAGSLTLVIDAGNAVTGLVAPQLFEELGCQVIPLHCELDGSFPNHDPDPTQEKNLADLVAKVQETGADVGVAFDGDGDRLVVVTAQGRIIWPDQLLMLFAKDVLARNPGADVLFDVKCSRQLNQLITSYGGRPIMWKTGHAHMKSKMIETGALIGGEYSGHIFIKDRWYGFDDGMYAMARLLEVITLRDQSVDDAFAAFPILPATPELKISISDGEKFALVEKLVEQGKFPGGKATTIDGLRVDFGKGWGLVRASNTSPALTLRFEAEDEESLAKIQALFKQQLLLLDSSLNIDF